MASATPQVTAWNLCSRSASSLGRIIAAGQSFTVSAGEAIYDEGEPAAFVYRLSAGCVRALSLDRKGRRIIHAFHLPGEIFGVERGTGHLYAVQAVCGSRLTRRERVHLRALAEADPTAAAELWALPLFDRDEASERGGRLARGSAVERLSYFLLEMAGRTPGAARIDLPMSRYDIADYLGLSSETVSRAFTALRRRGLVSTDGRSVTLDPRRLALCSGVEAGSAEASMFGA